MKYTKSILKELIIEVAKEHSLDFGSKSAPSFFNEEHDFSHVDEEEKREWNEFIERDMLALYTTLENAKEAMGELGPEREEIFDLLTGLVGAPDYEEEEIEEEW